MAHVHLFAAPTSSPAVKRDIPDPGLFSAERIASFPGAPTHMLRGTTSTQRTPRASSLKGTVATSGMWMEMNSLNMGWVYGPSLSDMPISRL